jgi:DNA invertase Pin-like site-specific DNA recombinase
MKKIIAIEALPNIPSMQRNKGKTKVAAYARVSTQLEEQMSSVKMQEEYYEHLIKSKVEWEFAGIYADEGITGTSYSKRNAFNRMIEDALSGKINLILTKSISRFARNTVDTLNTIRKLKQNDVVVYFEKENLYTE